MESASLKALLRSPEDKEVGKVKKMCFLRRHLHIPRVVFSLSFSQRSRGSSPLNKEISEIIRAKWERPAVLTGGPDHFIQEDFFSGYIKLLRNGVFLHVTSRGTAFRAVTKDRRRRRTRCSPRLLLHTSFDEPPPPLPKMQCHASGRFPPKTERRRPRHPLPHWPLSEIMKNEARLK